MGRSAFRKHTFVRLFSVWLAAVLLCLVVSGCAEVPLTHRMSLQLLPDSQLMAMGLQEYSKVLRQSKLSEDRERVEMVRRVGGGIAAAAEAFLKESGQGEQIKEYRWEFNLIEDDKTVNAWCMPGGKVAVYTGILPVTRDETGLAVVMGHEVAHALANHGNERMSQALLATMGEVALAVALRDRPGQTRNLFLTAFGVGAGVGILLPYSRIHESEADRIGLMLMARAGYDPREAIPFWERMNEQGGSSPPEFLSTHPAPASRIQALRSHIPEAMQYYRPTQSTGKKRSS
ncbi:MAG: M48 family metallopeptidase [Deltaproteobacteria bacterium]|nr:M48 family metallopeptidase [Deltaproteobacteria bacterium]